MKNEEIQNLKLAAKMVIAFAQQSKRSIYKARHIQLLAQGVIDLVEEVFRLQLQIQSMERMVNNETDQLQKMVDKIIENDKTRSLHANKMD